MMNTSKGAHMVFSICFGSAWHMFEGLTLWWQKCIEKARFQGGLWDLGFFEVMW